MPVDEFGREIPAVGGGGGGEAGHGGGGGTSSSAAAPHHRSRSRSRDRDDDWRTGGGADSAAGAGAGNGAGRSAAAEDDLARDPFGLDARGSGGGGGGAGGDSSSRGGYEGRGRRGDRDRGDDRGGSSGSRSRGRSRGASFGGGGGGSYYGPADGDRDRDGGGSGSRRGEGSRSGRPRPRSSRRGGGGGKGGGGGGGGDYYGPSGGGGGGGRRRSPSPESGHYGSSSSRRRSGGGGGGGRHSHGGGGGGHHHHHHHGHGHHGHGHRHKAHPSERYVDGPLLCEYLWNEEVKGGDNKDHGKEDNTEEKKVDDAAEDGDDDAKEHDDGGNDDDGGDDKHKDENEDSANANISADEAKKENDAENDNGGTAKDEAATTTTTTTYSNYVSTYCLSYVRTFFNDHLDDAWFRNRYSPLERRRVAQTERDRKAYEAHVMIAVATESLEKQNSATITKKEEEGDADGGGGGSEEDKPCDFVLAARLSGGKKPGAGGTAGAGGGSAEGVGVDAALRSSRGGDAGGTRDKKGGGSTAAAPSDVPQTHVHASVSSNRTLRVLDVPCHVTDKQLSDALADRVDLPAASGKGSNGGIVAVYSTTVGGDSHGSASGVGTHDHWKRRDGGSGGGGFLDRSCFVVMESVEARENLLENLTKANEDSHRRRHRGDKDKGKGPAAFLELDVDCTDPYGRYDIDADGKGSGPANADEFGPDDEDNPGKLPIRRATVFVATASPFSEQPTSVLSAAVSSSARIGRDGAQAITISRALDVAAAIPRGTRLDDLLELLFPAGTGALESASSSPDRRQEAEDILDVTIAYLRRVHLFSFYNGCTSADNLGDVLGGKHPSGTIHLRLSGADEILKKAEEEAEAPFDEEKPESDPAGGTAEDGGASVTKDLLVRRLDESISKALEEMTSSVIAASSDDCPVDDKTNALAKEIEAAEEAVTPTWINDHALVDEDGRARCSFHFCRKLFKDRKFLEKHLVKKHSEHLRAEKAKCHDGHMMKAWDAEEVRPVPPVLVDCGSRFGMVPSNVVGAEPVAEDPEPGLWAKEEERRAKIEEEQRQRRERRAAAAEADGEMDNGLGAGSKRPRGASGNFVDVDDMQDQKVELSFEAVEVPVPQPKKKKKKRKLL